MRSVALILAWVAMFPAVSCKTSASGPVDSVCTPGQALCLGNHAATCQDNGKLWDVVFCGATQYCDGGSCQGRGCTPPGKGSCVDTTTADQCPGNGAASAQVACKNGQQCFGGECLPAPCDAGTTKCLYDQLATCTGGGWDVQPCGKSQACKGDACAAKVCEPESAACQIQYNCSTADCPQPGSPFEPLAYFAAHPSCTGCIASFAGLCNSTGTDRTVTACNSDENCYGGFCFKIVSNPPLPEETTPDVLEPVDGVAPELVDGVLVEAREELPQVEAYTPGANQATINGTVVKFALEHDATWVVADAQLMLNLVSKAIEVQGIPGQYQQSLEIRLKGVVEGQLGTFKCEDVSSVGVEFWYRYGKYAQGQKCKDFDYEGKTCTVNILEFGPADGGRIRGTFTDASLTDCQQDGTTVTVTDGTFDVGR